MKIGDSVWARVSEPPTSIDYASFEDFGLVVIDHFGKDRELANVESGVLMRLRLFSSAEVATREPLAVTESQQNSQMTAETKACAGSHLRPVLHNESGQNCRGQLAERRDACSLEVLSKLIQVVTVIANGASCESRFATQILSKPRSL